MVVKADHAGVAWDAVVPRPTKGELREMRDRRRAVHHLSAGNTLYINYYPP